jgi:hypothetical protein
MKLNSDPVEGRNRRCASTKPHGIASRTKLVIIFVNNLIFTVRFVTQSGAVLNKTDTVMCDDLVTAYLWCLYIILIERNIFYLSENIFTYIYLFTYIWGYLWTG